MIETESCKLRVIHSSAIFMHGLLLTTQPLIRVFLLEPGAILFGVLLMLMTASVTLVFIVKKQPSLIYILLGFLFLIFLSLIGILTFDLVGTVDHVYVTEATASLSEAFSTHRWLLIQVPVLLTFVAIVLGWTCRNDLAEKHAKEYVMAMQVCVCVSFLAVLLIGVESLI